MLWGWVNEIWQRVRTLARSKQVERDLENEAAFHLAKRTQDNRAAGLDAEEAGYAARRQFGNSTILKERTRELWIFASLDRLWRDFTYAFRTLAKKPGFAAVAMVTLGLGIGATA